MKKNISKLAALTAIIGMGASNAMAVAPLDLDASATTLAGYVGDAATAGLVVAVAIWGLRVIIRGFKAVANK